MACGWLALLFSSDRPRDRQATSLLRLILCGDRCRCVTKNRAYSEWYISAVYHNIFYRQSYIMLAHNWHSPGCTLFDGIVETIAKTAACILCHASNTRAAGKSRSRALRIVYTYGENGAIKLRRSPAICAPRLRCICDKKEGGHRMQGIYNVAAGAAVVRFMAEIVLYMNTSQRNQYYIHEHDYS